MKQSSVEMASESEQAKRGTPSSFLRVAGSIRGLVTVAAEQLASEDFRPPCPDKSGRIDSGGAFRTWWRWRLLSGPEANRSIRNEAAVHV